MKNRRKAVQPFEIKKRKIDIFRNYEANGFGKNQWKFENFSTLISKKSTPRIESKNFEEVLLKRRIAVSGKLHLLYVLHESFLMSSCPASFVEEFA